MSIDPETLMAYVDGELDPIAAKRVERAADVNPALARDIAKERRLRERLRSAFDPVASVPPSDALIAMLHASGRISTIAEARPKRQWRGTRWLPAGGAVAAALVLGLMLGRGLPQAENPLVLEKGALMARGEVARALDTQLASVNTPGKSLRILVSFRRGAGDYCRAFETNGQAAVACRDAHGWQVELLRATEEGAITEYRQAGSTSAAVLAEAQEMMAGEPLDAAGERAAVDARWGEVSR
jgi:hypothetical protein